jgi:flagellar assembly factor FliW
MAEPARKSLADEATTTVQSARFGTYQVPSERIVHLPEGLIGYPTAQHFALLESSRPGSLFHFLLCVDLPELGFVVCDPGTFWPGYLGDLPRPENGDPAQTVVLVLVTVPANPREMTANLMAPLMIDLRTRQGAQVVLDNGRYSTRHPVLPPAAAVPAAPTSSPK